jgi:serine/threonine-protein kinase
LAGVIISQLSFRDDKPEPGIEPKPIETYTYEDAYAKLRTDTATKEGFQILKDLGEKNDPQALFTLSRLYFKSGEESDNINSVDSLQEIRDRLRLQTNNSHAHELLIKAVKADSSDYRAIYELGCDYKSNLRGTNRNSDSARIYLEKALEIANANHDTEYVTKITEKKSNL